MALIITDRIDLTTNITLDWLSFYKKKFIVCTEPITISFDNLSEIIFNFENLKIHLKDITSVWFRRNRLRINYSDFQYDTEDFKRYHSITKIYIENYVNYIFTYKIKTLGNPFRIDLNKLEVLSIASQVGLTIPRSIIVNNKEDLKKFFQNTPLITKLLFPINTKYKDKDLNFLTQEVDLELINDSFSFSFFQEKIEKKYEIRTFYLAGKFFSKAIYSQRDEQTKIDYRNYNYKKPNREVPFKLPHNIKTKIRRVMEILNLNTGSIDLILNEQNQFVFLEINPVGQFSDMSYNCKYVLEKEIAKFL